MTTVSKKLTSKAGVTIPKAMRLHLGWDGGMAIDLQITADGALLIKPHVDLCRFCGSYENVKKYKDICVCKSCGKDLKEVIEDAN